MHGRLNNVHETVAKNRNNNRNPTVNAINSTEGVPNVKDRKAFGMQDVGLAVCEDSGMVAHG